MEEMDFKNACIGFDWKRIPYYDREYLKTMYWNTVTSRNVIEDGKFTNISFKEMYDKPRTFVFVQGHDKKRKYLRKDINSDYVSSHLLNSKKYFLCWRYS